MLVHQRVNVVKSNMFVVEAKPPDQSYSVERKVAGTLNIDRKLPSGELT